MLNGDKYLPDAMTNMGDNVVYEIKDGNSDMSNERKKRVICVSEIDDEELVGQDFKYIH